jgi:hypothetical protein
MRGMVVLLLAAKRVAVMAFLRALFVCAVMVACLAGRVHAKDVPNPLLIDEELRRKGDAAVDQEYKATLKRTRKDAVDTAPADPWTNMRGGDDSKSKR